VRGGAYFPELLAADADAALAELGAAAVAGRGVGAYVALLLAAARPEAVPAALLLPGAGLEGGGALPQPAAGRTRAAPPDLPADPGVWTAVGVPDPALVLCEADLRPVDYAEQMAARARCLLLLENGGARPPWWQAVRRAARARALDDAHTAFAALAEAIRSHAS
jgi:pimeloyl-ACP methyl ester carboxylesterase